jgi:hypothetical protein
MRIKFLLLSLIVLVNSEIGLPQLIIDHTCTAIEDIPQEAILTAKSSLHIAYGHTSHGSQLTEGMSGLISFANDGGRGMTFTENIFDWNNGGTDGALDLHDYAMNGDAGYYPDWYNETVTYLNDNDHDDVNVIMWSWCGQVGSKFESGVLWDEYLGPMTALEQLYQDVTFVYMTGHLDYSNRENTNRANDSIRSFCARNQKVLFDFADIESFSPDGTNYKETADDACDYYNTGGDSIGNWAVEYQNTHTVGIDWYYCGSQHSEPLNANRKAYAAWWMFASLAGWNYTAPPITVDQNKEPDQMQIYPNPANSFITIQIDNPETSIRNILICSTSGQIIRSTNTLNTGASNALEINTAGLSEGIYILQAQTNSGNLKTYFSIIH